MKRLEKLDVGDIDTKTRSRRLTSGGEGGNRGRDGWMASPTQWT